MMSVINALLFVGLISLSGAVFANKTDQRVKIDTDLGSFVIELKPEIAPVTVKNFLDYVESGFYEGTIFHRVVPGFVVQGGGMTYDFVPKKTRDPIVNEASKKLKNITASVAMARTSDPDSATSQFYINVNDNSALDAKLGKPGYTVFGHVVEGMETIKKIEKEPLGMYRSFPEAPNYPVRILKATLLK